MSTLLGIHSLSKSYGTQLLFKKISFTLSQGDRVGLIGPNGSGKSTLLKILIGMDSPDEGSVSRRRSLCIGYASQMPAFPSLSLEKVLITASANRERCDPTDLLARARILLGKMQFPNSTQNAEELSGGWKKRLDLARALMDQPDLLLLDEPTNHLDLEGILWLERFLLRENIAYLIVSHDRYFLENVANKIIELNRCYPQGLFACEGNMSSFMERKEAFLEAQEQQQQGLASVVRDEVAWLKRSPKARTTKSQSRIQRAYALMEELAAVKKRNEVAKVDLEFSASDRETRKLIVAKNVSKSLGGKLLFQGVDLLLSPGSRLGIVGQNGSGKTTFLKILAGTVAQDKGTVKCADDLRLVYFDQLRESIPGDISLKQALSPTSDLVNYRGQLIHVNGWAKKFLFSPDRLQLPVRCLSGGERARILIAKLMLQPADVLFLDEPTNDLDIPTLEVIEEGLREFTGAVVLISHDRCLMDRVCTQILGLGLAEGKRAEFFADYNQWESACKASVAVRKESPLPLPFPPVKEEKSPAASSKKLSYREQKELDGMEQAILAVEEEIAVLQQQLDEPTTSQDATLFLELYHQLSELQQKLDLLFARWQCLRGE